MTAALEREATVLDLFDAAHDGAELHGLAPDEIVIDCFAGGGGASLGIEWATGRSPDEAINHSATAIAIHEANHPTTRHHHSDIWEVAPVDVARGRPVGLLWLSPDCTHFSRAKGGKPISKKIRILAHVAVRYAKDVRPRVIALENVEEFLSWGPISRETKRPDPRRKGQSFRAFVRQLRRLGYVVEWRLLRGCDFGAPTTRKRLFLVARRDGQPIRWPVPTHGRGRGQAWRTAAECIDWSLPCPSIFLTPAEGKVAGVRRPLAEKTLRRIARGIDRFVLQAADPFLVSYYGTKSRGGERTADLGAPLPTVPTENRFALVEPFLVPMQRENRPTPVEEPLQTVTTQVNRFNLIVPTLVQTGYGEREGQAPRSLDLHQPLGTVVGCGAKHALVAAFMAQHNTGLVGHPMTAPVSTIVGKGCTQGFVAANLVKLKGTARDGQPVSQPLPTVQAQGTHHAVVASTLVQFNRGSDGRTLREPMPTVMSRDKLAEVRAFLTAYYGSERDGQALAEPMRTVTSRDRLGLVVIQGTTYEIADIGMRMLSPRELARAQGFPDSYVLDVVVSRVQPVKRRGRVVGERVVRKPISKEAKVEMVGNSVNPHVACALLRANLGAPVARERAA